MRKQFRIETIGDPDQFAKLIGKNVLIKNDPIIRRFANYCLIREDFRTVLELNKTIEDLLTKKYFFLKFYTTEKDRKKLSKFDVEDFEADINTYNTLLIQSLFTTITITYAKWFTQGTGRNKPKLEPKDVFKKVTPNILKTHNLVMEYRHQYFAHSGINAHEAAYPIYFSDPIKGGNDFLTFFPAKKRMPTLSEVKKFHLIFLRAFNHVYEQSESLRVKVTDIIRGDNKLYQPLKKGDRNNK